LAFFLIVVLNQIMTDPVYYLLARIDITGGSTGWHRAALIQSAIAHLQEWWLAGTDVTRHWMPTGIYANETQTDITNHYIAMGVMGGLLLMAAFIWVLVEAFICVGKALRLNTHAPRSQQFMIWVLGCILLGHAVTFFSISYFGQEVVFLYLLFGSIGSLHVVQSAYNVTPKNSRALSNARGRSIVGAI
jgi:hypothetical protein